MARRVVLLGAGHAHLFTLKRTAEFVRRGFELVLVAPGAFWYSGLATGVLAGIYPPELDQIDAGALALLGQGLVHAAGVHFATEEEPEANARAVREALGPGYRLLRVAGWEEGLSLAPATPATTVGAALRARHRRVGREAGSAARQCLDELLPGRPPPRRLARDHRGVAEAVRCGWADAGVCHRLAAEEAGLRFFGLRREQFDLCYPEAAGRTGRSWWS